MSKAIHYIGLAVGVAVVALLVWLMLKIERKPSEPSDVVRYDTVVVVRTDTVRVRDYAIRYVHHYDTLVVNDTVYIRDEPQRYEFDSVGVYRLEVEAVKMYGYSLDICRVDTFTRYIPTSPAEPKKRAKAGQSVVVGLQVGYGLGVQPSTMQARFEPYIGVGVTYGFGITF